MNDRVTIERETLQAALDALEYFDRNRNNHRMTWAKPHATALRAALAADNDCTPNHLCNGRMVHLPNGEMCERCDQANPTGEFTESAKWQHLD